MTLLIYLSKKFFMAVFLILLITLLVSYLIRFTGDPALIMTQNSTGITAEDLNNIRVGLGTDKPFLIQYFNFIKNALTGDLGKSFISQALVLDIIKDALPNTALLAFISVLISIIVSIPLGILSALRKGKILDQSIRVFSLIGLSFPNFWLGSMLILLFAVKLQILPVSGYEGISYLILPSITIALILTATNIRLVRSSMLEILSSQYIMVARSKGLKESIVIYKHALKNSSITLVTYFGLQFGSLLGGIIIIESVFNWPGMGTLAINAIQQRDFPVLQGVVIVFSVLIILVNFIVDILYSLLDPRIRIE